MTSYLRLLIAAQEAAAGIALVAAIAIFPIRPEIGGSVGIAFWIAVTLLEHAELTGSETSRAEARATFEQLGATPWLQRADVGSPALAARVR